MSYKNLQSFKIRDYKCFLKKNDYQGFDEIKPINIIIGKNNSGKSKLLEFLQEFIKKNKDNPNLKLGGDFDILVEKTLEEAELKSVFREGHSGGELSLLGNAGDHWSAIGYKLVNKKMICTHNRVDVPDHGFQLKPPRHTQALQMAVNDLGSRLKNPFQGYECLVIQAERDIKIEGANLIRR